VNLKNRQTALAVAVAALVAVFALDKIVITPLTASWKRRAETIAELRESIRKGQSMIDRENNIRRVWNDMRKNTLPADTSHAEKAVLEAFDRWSRDTRVTVNAIKPQWKRGESDEYSLLECRVDAAGDIGTLTKFLYEVEHSEMALRIDAVELKANDPAGQRLGLGLSVSGLRLTGLNAN